MKIEDIQEEYSKAWLYVMAACADCTVEFPTRDVNSVDARITSSISGTKMQNGVNIEVQLKCTRKSAFRDTRDTNDNDFYVYDLKIKNYNELRGEALTPRILILLIAPENQDEWAEVNDEETRIKKSAYWVDLKGLPKTENKRTIAIKIPKSNLLTPIAVKYLIKYIADNGELS